MVEPRYLILQVLIHFFLLLFFLESNSINLKELSQSIEEVTVTPDIYIIFTPPNEQGISI